MNSEHFEFFCEIDKLKSVLRQSRLINDSRQENSAEHSWHVAMMAIVLAPCHGKYNLDQFKIVKMLLIHDLVEIDTGDSFLYDDEARQKKVQTEQVAAQRIFALLPSPQNQELLKLWQEYEERVSPEAKFAYGLDRLQPIIHNYMNKGDTWVKNRIKKQQVLDKIEEVRQISPDLYGFILELLEKAEKKGFFKHGQNLAEAELLENNF